MTSVSVVTLGVTARLKKVVCVFSVTQLCASLCDPMDCSLPGSCVHGISQERILKWVAMLSPRGILLTQGWNLYLLHWQADSSPLSHQGSPRILIPKCLRASNCRGESSYAYLYLSRMKEENHDLTWIKKEKEICLTEYFPKGLYSS